MKKKLTIVLIGLTLVLTLIFGSLPGCAPAKPPPAPLAPGVEGGIVWRWQHNLPKTDPMYFLAEDLVSDIKIATGGRLVLDLQPMGTFVGNLDILDAVGKGTVEIGTSFDDLWGEKDPRFYIAGNLPGSGMTFAEVQAWMADRELKGKVYVQEVFAKFGVHALMWDFGPPQQDYSANKALASAKDYSGAKIRATGYTAMVLKEPEFKAVVSAQKEDDVYAALEKGTIDAAFVGMVTENAALNLQKVAKYAGFPGMSQLSRLGSILINRANWDSLTDDIKRIFEQCCLVKAQENYAYKVDNDAKIFNDLQKAGIIMVKQDEDCQRAWFNASSRVADAIAEKDADFKKMLVAYRYAQDLLRPYIKLQTPNYEDLPGVVPKYKW